MSKLSVFKFNLNGQNNENANSIIQEYLFPRVFYYDPNMNAYITGRRDNTSQAKDIAASVALSGVATALTGNATAIGINTIERGFEYYFNNNELIIKAFLFSPKTKAKSMIHSTFNNSQPGAVYYGDLKTNLFKKLEANNITLTNTEVEKINDGSESKMAKKILVIILAMISIVVITFIVVLNI